MFENLTVLLVAASAFSLTSWSSPDIIFLRNREGDRHPLYSEVCDAQDNNPYQAGVYKSTSTIMVDLRKAVPSFFLRPHAQHALMLRKRSSKYEDFMDYTDRIIGIAKIRVKDGLKWIGQTGLLSVQSLFPPPYYDTGYANLLNEYKKPSNNQINTVDYIKLFGSIQDISH